MTPTRPHLQRSQLTLQVSGHVRAEMARHQKSASLVADRLRVSRATLARRLDGRQPWTLDELERVAEIIGIPVDTLLIGRPEAST